MCCDPIFSYEEEQELTWGECPECGNSVNQEKESVSHENCFWSPIICENCGYRPCDGSC